MDKLLSKIDPEKKARILNSAFEEFGKNGFENASTNAIVERAGISKGLLFHYFGSKQSLYDALKQFAMEYIITLLEAGIDWQQSDLLLRVQQIAQLKLTAMEQYPHIYDFLKADLQDFPAAERQNQLPDRALCLVRRAYTENIDYTLFRPDIEVQKAVEILQWTVEGAASRLVKEKDMDIQQITAAFGEYIPLLRKLLYREEGSDAQ